MTSFSESHHEARVVPASPGGNVFGEVGPYHLNAPWFQEITDLVDQV